MTNKKTKAKTENYEMNEVERNLLEGMELILAHQRGEIELDRYTYIIDDEVDVKEIRSQLSVTQQQFANLLGASVSAVRHWEAGRRKPCGTARTLLNVIKDDPSALFSAFVKPAPNNPRS